MHRTELGRVAAFTLRRAANRMTTLAGEAEAADLRALLLAAAGDLAELERQVREACSPDDPTGGASGTGGARRSRPEVDS